MTDNMTPATGVEPMIDAKQAAAALRLPYYWFADHAMRSKYRIPHYLMGGLVTAEAHGRAWLSRRTARSCHPHHQLPEESHYEK